MKKYLLRLILAVAVIVPAALTFTSCDDYYGPDYGYGPEFYDNQLIGTWELININGAGVPPGERNWLQFMRGGVGNYYYYSGGAPYRERMTYWCEEDYNGSYINISYSGSRPEIMEYWFANNASELWMQWRTANGLVRYGYRYVSDINWGAPKAAPSATAKSVAAPGK